MTAKQFQQLKPGDIIWYVDRLAGGWRCLKRTVIATDRVAREVIFDGGAVSFGLQGWPYKFCHISQSKAQAELEQARKHEDEVGL